MNVYVPSTGYAPRMKLFHWLPHDWPITVVTHYRDNERSIRKHFPWVKRIICTNQDHLVNSRNFILNEVAKKDEWFIGMDDDIQGIQIVCKEVWPRQQVKILHEDPPKGYRTWREAYRVLTTPAQLLLVFNVLKRRLELQGTIYGGFSNMENPFFRQTKWSEVSHIRSNTYLMKNTRKIPWAGRCGHDTRMTVETVYHYGSVAVLNYCYALHKPYVEGGLGKRDSREPFLHKQFTSLIEQYKGLVTWTRNRDHIRFIRYNHKSVEQWKAKHESD